MHMNAAKRPSRSEAREQARQKAREIGQKSSSRNKRLRFFTQAGLAVAALAVIAILTAVIVEGTKPAGPGPLNMASDGIKIGTDYKAIRTDALPDGADPVATPTNPAGVVDITIFVDYLCPICGEFEQVNGRAISDLVSSGAATVELHPIAFLDNRSQGTRYSTRATNAAACVANYTPDSFFMFHNLLFANQPAENTPGLDDTTIIGLATQAGANAQVADCIDGGDFVDWVAAKTERALSGAVVINNADPSFTGVTGTPTVLINGVPFQYSYPFNSAEFLGAVQAASGN
jgi:protein-disulfide isomerase